MSATRICIVRHGETHWNVERRIQGQLDIPLNATGIAQAEATAAGLAGMRFAAAYSSDLGRAWQTAEAVAGALDLRLVAEPGLRERHYGSLQGRTAAELLAADPLAHRRYAARDVDDSFGTGESLRQFAVRVEAVIEALAHRHIGQSLLLVSHGAFLDICYRKATGRALSAPRDFAIPNAALNWLSIDTACAPAAWRLDGWAVRTHLERALEESAE